MSKYREPSEPYHCSFEDIDIIDKLLKTNKLTDKQKEAIRNLLREHYSRD